MSAAVDDGFVLKQTMIQVTKVTPSVTIYTDCGSLYDYLHKSRGITEKRLLVELEAIKQAMEREEVNHVEWVPTNQQLADTFTKTKIQPSFYDVFSTATLQAH